MLNIPHRVRLSAAVIVAVAGTATAVYPQAGLPPTEKKKIAQTGYQFLSISSDARAAALADAMTTMTLGSSSLFFNPAGMAHMDAFLDVTLAQNFWIADITHNAFAIAVNPMNGRLGTFGFSFINVDYGEFLGTIVSANAQGYVDTETFYPSAMAAGVGYSRRLSERFAVGGQAKYTTQYLGWAVTTTDVEDSLGLYKAVSNAVAFDFGTIYQTGLKGLLFGMSVRNFSNEIEYVQESFQLPLTFRIGASINVFNFLSTQPAGQALMLTVDASHPRSYPEYMSFGLEYTLREMFHVRGGYITGMDERSLTFGFGLALHGFGLDYAYTPFGVFGNVQRFSLRFSM
jgi:hypothetical protein